MLSSRFNVLDCSMHIHCRRLGTSNTQWAWRQIWYGHKKKKKFLSWSVRKGNFSDFSLQLPVNFGLKISKDKKEKKKTCTKHRTKNPATLTQKNKKEMEKERKKKGKSLTEVFRLHCDVYIECVTFKNRRYIRFSLYVDVTDDEVTDHDHQRDWTICHFRFSFLLIIIHHNIHTVTL